MTVGLSLRTIGLVESARLGIMGCLILHDPAIMTGMGYSSFTGASLAALQQAAFASIVGSVVTWGACYSANSSTILLRRILLLGCIPRLGRLWVQWTEMPAHGIPEQKLQVMVGGEVVMLLLTLLGCFVWNKGNVMKELGPYKVTKRVLVLIALAVFCLLHCVGCFLQYDQEWFHTLFFPAGGITEGSMAETINKITGLASLHLGLMALSHVHAEGSERKSFMWCVILRPLLQLAVVGYAVDADSYLVSTTPHRFHTQYAISMAWIFVLLHCTHGGGVTDYRTWLLRLMAVCNIVSGANFLLFPNVNGHLWGMESADFSHGEKGGLNQKMGVCCIQLGCLLSMCLGDLTHPNGVNMATRRDPLMLCNLMGSLLVIYQHHYCGGDFGHGIYMCYVFSVVLAYHCYGDTAKECFDDLFSAGKKKK